MVSPSRLLDVWDQGLGLEPAARPLALMSLAMPGRKLEDLAEISLGTRDAHLLRLRRELFGSLMECVTSCPACATELEFTVSADELLKQGAETAEDEHWLEADSFRIRFRSPNTADLVVLARLGANLEDHHNLILSRCILTRSTDRGADTAMLPPDVVRRLLEEMEQRDRLAMVWLGMDCTPCGHAWKSLFDIGSHLWTDLDRWARGLLHEVHLLARAYGWTESEVLRLSAARRAYYLGVAKA
jgi:hypothetical protein